VPRRSDVRSNQKLMIALMVGAIAVAVGVSAVLASQPSNQETYITELQEISDQSKAVTQSYDDAISEWQNGQVEDSEMTRITERNLGQLELLLSRLKALEPPGRFADGHELIIRSLEYEMQSNEHMLKYIETRDQAEYEKSSELFQLAFDYEAKAFEAFAKANKNT